MKRETRILLLGLAAICLALVLAVPAGAADSIFWSAFHSNTIGRVDLAGGNGGDLALATPSAEPTGTVIDAVVTKPAASGTPTAAPIVSPSVKLLKVKFDKRHGTATVLATVSGPGTLTLTGKKVVRRSVKASGAGVAKLKVAAKGKARRALTKSGKVKVRFAIGFVTTEGGSASVSRSVTLHRSVRQ